MAVFEPTLESRSIVIQKAALNKKLQDYSNRKQDFSLVRVKIKQGFVVWVLIIGITALVKTVRYTQYSRQILRHLAHEIKDKIDMSAVPQIKVPATYMRGGTSKGVFFKLDDLPAAAQVAGQARDQLLLKST